MKIAVIGAGIAGLTAGRELLKSGHEVVVFEQNHDYGGLLATRSGGLNGEIKIDCGVPFLQAESPEFQKLLRELESKKLIREWKGKYVKRSVKGEIHPFNMDPICYYAPDGMNAIGEYLGRMLDVRLGEKVGGLTHIGAHRTKKRTWMVNFPTAATENFDAVIIATSARQAYAILNTTVDEIKTLKIIREIDEITYNPQFTLSACFPEAVKLPGWNGMRVESEIISWISNESKKRKGNCLAIHATTDFTKKHLNEDEEVVAGMILKELSLILGSKLEQPNWYEVVFWKYSKAVNMLKHNFMELEDSDTPLAVIGGYMNGNDVESAYLSGLKLSEYWNKKFAGQELIQQV